MTVLFLGVVTLAALFLLQLFFWRVANPQAVDDVNEYLRTLDGRRAILHVLEHEGVSCIRAQVDLPEDAPRLELARRDKLPVLAKWVGALPEQALNDEALAARYVARVPESPKAFEALARMKQRLLDALERFDIRELKLDRRSLQIVVVRAGRPDLDAIGEVLSGLATAALLPGGVLVKGEESPNASCGFCHADLVSEGLATVSCAECSAVVHEPCWAEHGRCPVLGCKGTPMRAAASSGRGAASSSASP